MITNVTCIDYSTNIGKFEVKMIIIVNFMIYLNESLINVTHLYPDPLIMTREGLKQLSGRK